MCYNDSVRNWALRPVPFLRACNSTGYAGAVGWWETITPGGIVLNQKQFYKSGAWKRARRDFIDFRLSVDGGLCQVCGQEPGLIVHHKIWLDDINCNDPDISLNADNFLYECQTCHNKEKDPRKATPGRCIYGPNGEIIRSSKY